MSAIALREIVANRAILAILVLASATVLLKDFPFFEPSYEDIYAEYVSTFEKAKELAQRDATSVEWSAFEEDVATRVKPDIDRLQNLCKRRPELGSGFFGPSSDLVTRLIRQPLVNTGKNLLRDVTYKHAEGFRDGSLPDIQDLMQLRNVRMALDAVRGEPSPTSGPPDELERQLRKKVLRK